MNRAAALAGINRKPLDHLRLVLTTHALSRGGWRITSRQYLDHTGTVLATIPLYRANVEANESGPPEEAV